jgi:hypothetical protein
VAGRRALDEFRERLETESEPPNRIYH